MSGSLRIAYLVAYHVLLVVLMCRQHKGSSLSMMVELLTAGLTGGAFSFEAREQDPDDSNSTPTCNSELLIAMDPAQVRKLFGH